MHILYANLVVLLPAIVRLVLFGGNHVYECSCFSYDRERERKVEYAPVQCVGLFTFQIVLLENWCCG